MDSEGLLNIKRTITREHHWPPHYYGGLYVDDQDEFGIMFWYDDIVETVNELQKKK
jgi:hypothetical protein